MKLMNSDVVKQVGYQIAPTIESMDSSKRKAFKDIILSLADRELKAIEAIDNTEKLKILSELYQGEYDNKRKEELYAKISALI